MDRRAARGPGILRTTTRAGGPSTNIAVSYVTGSRPGSSPAPEPAERFRQNRRADYTEGVIAGAFGSLRLPSLEPVSASPCSRRRRRRFRSPRLLRSSVELTAVTVTVRDGDGRLVPDLPADAFTVFEDGEPQAITQFTHDRVPVGLGVLLDVSDSMFGQRIRRRPRGGRTISARSAGAGRCAFVMTFNHTPHLLTTWITPTEAATVRSALDTLRPSGGTAIYDSVIDGVAGDRSTAARSRGAGASSRMAPTRRVTRLCATCVRHCCARTRSSMPSQSIRPSGRRSTRG